MKYKRGITVSSLVVYIVLLFAFLTVSISVSGTFTSGLYEDKGLAVNLANLDKVQYYLNKSSMESITLTVGTDTYTFSNGDVYSYDTAKSTIYFNGGILSENVTGFEVISSENNVYEIQASFIKYSETLQRNIKIYVGE